MKTIMAVLIIVALSMTAWAEDYRDYGLEQRIRALEENQIVHEVINDRKQRAMKEEAEMQRIFNQPDNSRSQAPPTPYSAPRPTEVK